MRSNPVRVSRSSSVYEGARAHFVTLYEVTRNYGGPEEGGWWYDWRSPVKSVSVRDAAHARKVANAWAAKLGDQEPLGSVLTDYIYELSVESRRGEEASKYTPHYE